MGASPLRVRMFPDRFTLQLFAGGEREEILLTMTTTQQDGDPAEDQSSRDGGVVPNHKVPGDIDALSRSSRVFPGEFLKLI